MPYLVDGHNLIPKIPGLSLKAVDDELQLIRLLQDFCRKTRKKVEVYFDNAPAGQPGKREFGRVTAHFVRQGSSADAAIRSRLRKMGGSAWNWTVVTSDREVAAASRESHARVVSSQEFAQTLLNPGGPEKPSSETDANILLGPDSVTEWLRIFGVDEENDQEK